MSWAWRKSLQLRPLIRPFICYRLGAGNKASLWFDRWSSLSPLSQIITVRDIHRAGFELSNSVIDDITNENWSWPVDWYAKYPLLNMYTVHTLIPNTLDRMVWISSNGADNEFYVSIAWDTICPRGDVVNWHDLVWFFHAIPRHAFHLWLVIKRKLKTQDVLRQWEVSSNTNLNLLRCPLCGL
ncbi:reverse transcriptase domain, reverse transcriptase zinc-binding domain protein [Tanacetum coccineum]|uniref:Reverse transcriptase domain, reverse transcriptase zinc-binding domain protein n=1 Tax=Tanacetum coccineum TaxID=301880 RepID=A0ABQ4YF37_9ASTR